MLETGPLNISEQRLRMHVDALAGRIGERNVFRPGSLSAAADYIENEWHKQGHSVTRQRYTVRGVDCDNLEIELPGTTEPKRILLAGAHYDTVPGSPGADDNGSGIATLLELGRALHGRGAAQTLRLVAFVNEEPPFFMSGEMGSDIYARAARARGDDIRIMLSLEMLGCFSDRPGSQRYPPLLRWFYPDRGDFIAFVSNLRSRRQLRQVVSAFRSRSQFPCERLAAFQAVPGVAWSDQISFWRVGYPALMVTDTAFYRYAYYHSPLDTPDRLDYARMAEVATGLAQALVALTGED